jgi:Protein of unknown function (DUF2726)
VLFKVEKKIHMFTTYGLALMVAAVAGTGLGALGYRAWAARKALNLRRIPEQWQLQVRPLFTTAERTTWQWLKRVFFDHHVLVKIPVIRFLLPRSATRGQHSHELLKGVYCSFTVCAPDGTVIGCVDVPGKAGLKASHRDLKKKLFDECGIAYTVLNTSQLPTLEALRAAFLSNTAPARQTGYEFASSSQMPFLQPADVGELSEPLVSNPLSKPALEIASGDTYGPAHNVSDANRAESPEGIDMVAVAAARSSLQAKLERSRKVRLAKIDELSASMGIVDDSSDRHFAASWDDSFIMGEDSRNPASGKQ